jgi:hypothetical protein
MKKITQMTQVGSARVHPANRLVWHVLWAAVRKWQQAESNLGRAALLVGLFAILVAPGVSAGPAQASQDLQLVQGQYGNVIFTAPPGWKPVSKPNAVLFIAPAAKEGTVILGILRGQVLTGSFRAWFAAALKSSLSSGEHVVQQTAVNAGRGDNAYDVLYTLQVVQGSSGTPSYRFYLAAHPGNRVEMIVYFASSKTAFSKYQDVLTAFIAGLHFANMPAQPAAQPKTQPGPQSEAPSAGATAGVTIFFGERSTLMFVPNNATPGGGSYQYQIRKFYYTFLPGNRVYNGLPPADNLAHVCDS